MREHSRYDATITAVDIVTDPKPDRLRITFERTDCPTEKWTLETDVSSPPGTCLKTVTVGQHLVFVDQYLKFPVVARKSDVKSRDSLGDCELDDTIKRTQLGSCSKSSSGSSTPSTK